MKHNHHFWSIVLTLAVSLGLFGSLVGCQTQTQPKEIRIGVIASITGPIPNVGKSTVDAANLAAKEINDAGGLEVAGQKYRIVLLIEDDEDKAETAVAAAQKLIKQENVVVIIGPQPSRDAIPVSKVAEEAKIPMLAPWSTNPDTTLGKQYVFRVAFIDPFQGQVMARFVFEELKATKAAVLYDVASAYNKELSEIFKEVFEQAGGTVVAFETYTTGETDFKAQLERIRDSGAEVLFLPNYYNEVPLQVRQARELGITAAIIGADAWGNILPEDLPDLEGCFYSTHYAPDIANDKAQTFIQAYRNAYNTTPDDVAALTYDAFGLLFQAIQSQGKVDPESIRLGLAGIQAFTGVTGTMEYRGTGDPVKSAVVLTIQDGKAVFYKLANP